MMSDELAARLDGAGVTYRQYDYWLRRGLVPNADPTPGSGNRRTLTDEQAEHLRIMAALVASGVTTDAAARLATALRAGYAPRLAGFRLVPLGGAA